MDYDLQHDAADDRKILPRFAAGDVAAGAVLHPTVLALPHIWGELGVQLAQPVSDVCAFALTVPLVLGVLRDMDRQQRLEKIR